MKKSFIYFFALMLAGQFAYAQCDPTGTPPVKDSVTCTVGANVTIDSVPTGNVIKLDVPVKCLITLDMCGTNTGTPPFTSGNNDSYVTILDNNAAGAGVLSTGDDGCTDVAAPGYGPTKMSFVAEAGTTAYAYITEYDAGGQDNCVADGVNQYVVNISVQAFIPPANDSCGGAIDLTLNIPVQGSTVMATLDTVSEGSGDTQPGIAGACNPPNGYQLYRVLWYTFTADSAGNHVVRLTANSFNGNGMDVVIYPKADINCGDISLSTLDNGLCNTIGGGFSTVQGDSAIYNLAAGDYYIVVSSVENGGDDFEIEVHKLPLIQCSAANAGTITGDNCWEFGQNIHVEQAPPFTTPTEGQFGTYFFITTAPLTNTTSPSSDPAFLLGDNAGAPPFILDFPVDSALLGTLPGGSYYLYIYTGGNLTNAGGADVQFTGGCYDMAMFQFTIVGAGENCNIGINEANALSNAISLYPNPANDVLNINVNTDARNTEYNIVNVNGQQVATGYLATGNNSIRTTNLSAGVYLLKVNKGTVTTTKRFVISR
jgi:hypothetical protein